MESREEIGNLVKGLRLSRKLTQVELSKLSNVPFATINKLERGTANPTLSTLKKILAVFGFELSARKIYSGDEQIRSL